MAAQPWWVISVSTVNGQPWQAVSFQGAKSAAQGASQGGILGGPFTTEAQAAAFGNAWSARTHHAFTDNPNLSSANPLTDIPAGAAQIGSAAASSTGLPQIGAFFASLGNKNLWIRAAKVMIGGALVMIGLAHMTGASNAVATVARKAPLPV